ncbi:unnamed protein product [Onchocerca flexuosa]|uniref:Uncharacterized protein n=1 Tax=Onchocerca flexuosa TaxID=387005 RepID=A0A183HKY1_9BILA|nr:unnamed protein product [Onchocerca flexuosa]
MLNDFLLRKRVSTASSSTATSRPLLPYVTHYSDSGFSSTLSSGSSCSFLPPPPPYRGFRGSTKQQHRIHRSLSDSKYGSTECHLMRLPTGLCAGSVNLQELCRAPRAGSWTSRVSSLFHLPTVRIAKQHSSINLE